MSENIPTIKELKDYLNSGWKFKGTFDRWLEQNDAETQKVALAWERERFDRLWQLEMDICKCEEAMQHLKVRMERTQNGIDYKAEFGDSE